MELISVGQHAEGWIAIGQHARGFVAIGQEATGVVAVGQLATGLFALGQMARGGIAVGQMSVGLVSVGMVSIGVFRTAAMFGFAGRAVPEIFSLMPLKRPSMGTPELRAPRARMVAEDPGWSEIRLVARERGEIELHDASGSIEGLRLAAVLRRSAWERAEGGSAELYGRLRQAVGQGWVVDTLLAPAERAPSTAGFLVKLGIRFCLLVALAFVVLVVAILPLWQALGSPVLRLALP